MASVFDLIKKAKQEKEASKGSFNPGKIPVGTSQWRVLPHPSEIGAAEITKLFSHDFAAHYIKLPGAADTDLVVVVCEKETFGKPCEVCDAIWEELRQKSDWDKVKKTRTPKRGVDPNHVKMLEDYRAKPVTCVNAVRTDTPGAKPEILGLPVKNVFDPLMASAERRMTMKGIMPFSTVNGVDVIFTRSGSGLDTKYSVELDTDAGPVNVKAEEVADLAALIRSSADDRRAKALESLSVFTGKPLAVGHVSSARAALPRSAEPIRPETGEAEGAFGRSTHYEEDDGSTPPFDIGGLDVDADVPDSVTARVVVSEEVAAVTAAAAAPATSVRRAAAAPALDAGILAGLDALNDL